MKRKVEYYLLDIKNETDEKNILPKEAFTFVYNNKLKDLGYYNEKAIEIKGHSNDYVAHVMKVDHDFAYIKIGRQHPSNTVELRNVSTLKADKVEMDPNQKLEIYTFCLLDLSTGIVSYMSMNGAPRVTVLRELFLKYDENGKKPIVSLAAIITPDIIKRISEKKTISSIEYTIAMPPDHVLSEQIGVSEKTFDKLQNIRTASTTLSLKAEKGKTLFKTSYDFERAVSGIMGKFGDALRKLVVRAKNQDEGMQPFNLMEHAYTQTVEIKQNADMITDNDLMGILKDEYKKCKEELTKYIRV